MRCAECLHPVADGLAACPHDGAPALPSVTEVLATGPVPLTQAVKVVDRVLGLLEALHAEGRAHGAIGPDAVLFRQRGEVMHVALWAPDRPPPEPYWPPEREAGPSADLFGVGVLLHHMITARLPPAGGALPSLDGQALQDVPEALDRLIGRLAAPVPAHRPRLASEVQEELHNLELDSTLSGARLAAIRAAVPDTPARQVLLSSPYDDEVDPHEDTYVRGRSDLSDAIRQVASERPSDPMADTLIGSRAQIEGAEGPTADVDMQDTLLGLPGGPSARAEALASLDARTEMLPENEVAPEAPGRWILIGVLAGLALGGVVAAVTLL